MNRVVAVGAVAALAGIVAGWIVARSPDDASSPRREVTESAATETATAPQEAVEIEGLRRALGHETRARKHLAQRVLELERAARDEIATAGESRTTSLAAEAAAAAARVELDAASGAGRRQPEIEGSSSGGDFAVFNVQALVAAGLNPYDAEELQDAWEGFSLDHLYLVDRATRENWRHKPRFQRAVARLEHALLEEVGEEGWDQLLYASGQPNRVQVREVLEDSTADAAGMLPGDVILRYGERAVFKIEWLQAATAHGVRGTPVSVEVMRDGEVLYLEVERGPLGTLIRNVQRVPVIR